MNAIAPGFNNYQASYSMFSDAIYKQIVDAYGGFANQAKDFRVMLARMADDITKLKDKYAQTKSESLAQIIQRKEQTFAALNQTLDDSREGYFEEGTAIAQQVQAYLGVSLANA